jgi:hypothetical protein
MNADDKFWANVLGDRIADDEEATTEDIIMRGMAHIMQELHEINEKLDGLNKIKQPDNRDSDDITRTSPSDRSE